MFKARDAFVDRFDDGPRPYVAGHLALLHGILQHNI